jgi:hypothetical protein
MALPGSGTLSLSQIRDEFGGSNPVSMSDYYRSGPYVTTNNTAVPTSGAISITNFYGAAAQFSFTISAFSNYSTPQDLRTLAINAGWNQSDYLVVTNNTIFSSNTTSTAALTISGSFPNGVLFNNTGYLIGMGGRGGPAPGVGLPGGDAIFVNTAVSINNTGTFIGGGGGGGSSGNFGWCGVVLTTAGGGGASGLTQSLGGAGNGVRTGDGNPSTAIGLLYGQAGPGKQDGACGVVNNPSGSGGAWGTPGETTNYYHVPGYAGGAAGNSVSGNSYITWVNTGTRQGPIV